jgi:hypothetical protein
MRNPLIERRRIMAGLMRQLLNADHRAEKTALRLFGKAVRRAECRAKSAQPLTKKRVLDADAIAAELEWLLRGELYRVNLVDPASYQAVLTAICAWEPRCQEAARQHCGAVQNELLTLLPQLRRWQQLDQLCQDYRQHLIEEAAPLIAGEEPSPLSGQTRASEADSVLAQRRYPTMAALHQDVGLKQITEKIEAVADMQRTLQTRQEVTTQCQSFQTVFQHHRRLIERDRDSAAMIFVKAVVTVLSLGLAAVLGIWSVKGQKTAQQIEAALQTPDSSSFF